MVAEKYAAGSSIFIIEDYKKSVSDKDNRGINGFLFALLFFDLMNVSSCRAD